MNEPSGASDAPPPSDGPRGNLLVEGIDGSCGQRAEAAVELIEWAAARAARHCTVDSDCHAFARRPECVFGCGFRAAVTDPVGLDAAIDRADAACLEGCPVASAACEPTPEPSAVCVGGSCRLQ